MRNLDKNGKRIVSGMRAIFDGSELLGRHWIEQGRIEYDRPRNKWLFVGDSGAAHAVVFDYVRKGHELHRVFKCYELERKAKVTK